MTIDRRETGPNLRDTFIAIAKAFGLSNKQAAAVCVTPESPTGISERTVYNRVETNRQYIEDIIRFVSNLRRETEVETKQLSKATVAAELELLLGDAVSTLRRALAEGDVKAAVEVLDRNLGKATQVHKHEGEVQMNHKVSIRQVITQHQDAIESQKLLAALPAEVLEAEVLPV